MTTCFFATSCSTALACSFIHMITTLALVDVNGKGSDR